MYAIRGIAVSLSVFLMVYCALSFAVVCAWRKIWLWFPEQPSRHTSTVLFALRMVPLAAAALITATFTVPSFLLLEPRAIDEPMGVVLVVLGLCGAAFGAFSVVNSMIALRMASRAVSTWSVASEAIYRKTKYSAPVPVMRITPAAPAMTAAGILHTKILVSKTAESLLTSRELQTALNHEMAHINRHDNFKKLLFRFAAFPGMKSLEAAWLKATEMAADDEAVSNAGEALDLAAALIKLSQLTPFDSTVDLTAALIHGTALFTSMRVKRLIDWNDNPQPSRKLSLPYGLAAAVSVMAALAAIYGHMLADIHMATEWLVR
jgi:beta-lactamase regulating signal transducer with metallopeptidase domain